jgi:hypothetical protein
LTQYLQFGSADESEDPGGKSVPHQIHRMTAFALATTRPVTFGFVELFVVLPAMHSSFNCASFYF